MNKFKKVFSMFLSISILSSCFSINSLAAAVSEGNITSGDTEYKDSIGSEVSDFTTNNELTGKDDTQGMESAFKDLIINEEESNNGNLYEEIDIYLTKAPIYSIKIPKTIIIGFDGLAEYNIGIKGDIAGTQKITVAPVDGIQNTDDIDFYLSEQYSTVDPKNDIVATIKQIKTAWTHSEVNNGKYTYLNEAGKIKTFNFSAGSWHGTFDFKINIENSKSSDSKYFSLYAPGVTTLQSFSETAKKQANDFATANQVSYYAAVTLLLFGISNDNNAIVAAQNGDDAFDIFFNNNYLGKFTQIPLYQNATSIDDIVIAAYGFSAHDLANYLERGEVPEDYDPFKDYDGPVYLTIANEYNVTNENRLKLPSDLVLPTHLFGFKVTGINNFAFSEYDEIEYIYVPSTYTEFLYNSFAGCMAKEIVIRSQNFELTDNLFKNNEYLEIITLPSNITEIPDGTFDGCTNLKQIIY